MNSLESKILALSRLRAGFEIVVLYRSLYFLTLRASFGRVESIKKSKVHVLCNNVIKHCCGF